MPATVGVSTASRFSSVSSVGFGLPDLTGRRVGPGRAVGQARGGASWRRSRPIAGRRGGDDDDGTGAEASGQERREKLAEDVDDILDEIDDVLEANAEDFVRSYVQKGGQ